MDWGAHGGQLVLPTSAIPGSSGVPGGNVSQLPPSPVPSLALCLLSLTKYLSSLMAALITEFISGPAGGPGEGVSLLGLSPSPVPH